MFAEYLKAAMRHAVIEQIEDGTYFGTVPGLQGVWANAATPDECATELESVIEGWVILAISRQQDIPEIDGRTVVYPKVGV